MRFHISLALCNQKGNLYKYLLGNCSILGVPVHTTIRICTLHQVSWESTVNPRQKRLLLRFLLHRPRQPTVKPRQTRLLLKFLLHRLQLGILLSFVLKRSPDCTHTKTCLGIFICSFSSTAKMLSNRMPL